MFHKFKIYLYQKRYKAIFSTKLTVLNECDSQIADTFNFTPKD